jgi:ribosomal protein RSM22 (predicted rRNA methylase)
VDRKALNAAAAALSDAYRSAPDRPRARFDAGDDAARVAYVATRFPATLAAMSLVAAHVAERVDAARIESLVELGAGPGPSLWAFAPVLPSLRRVSLVDRDHRMLAVARELGDEAPPRPGIVLDTRVGGLAASANGPSTDLVVMSYALGECAEHERAGAVDHAWAATEGVLVLIEPGTSAGFDRIRAARERLLGAGASLVAPCPHERECPVQAPDWCHFSVRLDRSRLHRQLKHGALGYEDEKFAYVVAARPSLVATAGRAPGARIISRPEVRSGLVRLRVCTAEGVAAEIVTKRDRERYRAARHARWGDAWTRGGIDRPGT